MRYWYRVYGHPEGVHDKPSFRVDPETALVYAATDDGFAREPTFVLHSADVHLFVTAGLDTPALYRVEGSCVYPNFLPSEAPWYQIRPA